MLAISNAVRRTNFVDSCFRAGNGRVGRADDGVLSCSCSWCGRRHPSVEARNKQRNVAHHHLPPRPRVPQTRFPAIETLDAVFHLPGLDGSARSKIAVRLEGQQEEPKHVKWAKLEENEPAIPLKCGLDTFNRIAAEGQGHKQLDYSGSYPCECDRNDLKGFAAGTT